MSVPRQEFLLKHLVGAVYWFDEGLQALLEASGWHRVNRTKSMIMINIADGVTRSSQIAVNLGISRQAVHLALLELVDEGLVVLVPDPDDRRAKRVAFSEDPRGRAMRAAALEALQQIESLLEERLGSRLYAQLRKALARDWGPPAGVGAPAR